MKAYIINRADLKNNIDVVKAKADGRVIYGVLKGNGYGLGMLQLAHELRAGGIDHFAVTDPKDALKLRADGFIDEEILVMSSTSDEAEVNDILDARAVATIGSYEAAVLLNGLALRRGEVAEAHIKIDTGMGRYGFDPDQTDKIFSIYRLLDHIDITGMYTHSNMALYRGKVAESQLAALKTVAEKVRAAGFDPGIIHIANSAYLFGHDMEDTDAVRIGSAFTGRSAARAGAGLKKIGYAVANVTEIRWLQEGHTVGYSGGYVTKKPTRIAVVPIGYNDGFLVSRDDDIFRFKDKLRYIFREIKLLFRRKRIYVTVNGKKAPVLGHIGMVHTVIDVTKIKCELGDEVIFDISPTFASPLLDRIYE